MIIKLLDELDSDIICLQEFWVNNQELVDLYKSHFSRRCVPPPSFRSTPVIFVVSRLFTGIIGASWSAQGIEVTDW